MIRRYAGALLGALIGWYGYGLVARTAEPWWAGLVGAPILAALVLAVQSPRLRSAWHTLTRRRTVGIDGESYNPRRWRV